MSSSHEKVHNILRKLPAIGKLISELDSVLVERNHLREERDLYLKKSQMLDSLLKEREAAQNPAADLNRRRRRILTESEVQRYKARIDEYDKRQKWFHSMNLGNGLWTSGFATKEALDHRIRSLHIPDDLTGMTFLDVASWDGYYAFEAEARGASRVLATDYFCWAGEGSGSKEGFLLAREILGSKVEDKNIEVYDLSPTTVGMWDIVLFSGIFYHMRDPIRAMHAAASVANTCMIVETHIDYNNMSEPTMRYIPRTPGNESSNYWRPNPAMILVLLNEMGFSRVDHRIAIEGLKSSTHGFFNAYR